jgi:hypothetical protein
MQNEGDPWKTTFYHRAIQTHIGRALRARYDLSQPMSGKLAQLVMQIDRQADRHGSGERPNEAGNSEPESPRGYAARPLRPLPGTS